MNKRFRYITTFAFVCITIVTVIFASLLSYTSTAGATSKSELMQKTLVNAMKSCYTDKYLVSPIEEGSVGGRFQISNFVQANGSFTVPTNVENNLNNASINCLDVFEGKGSSMKSVYSFFNKSQPTKVEQLGYETAGGASRVTYQCVTLRYYLRGRNNVGAYYNTNKLCVPVRDGKVIISDIAADVKSENVEGMSSDAGSIRLYVTPGMRIVADINTTGLIDWSDGILATEIGSKTWNDIKTQIDSTIGGLRAIVELGQGNAYSVTAGTDSNDINASYETTSDTLVSSMEIKGSSAGIALEYLTGNTDFSAYKFTDSDWYYLYRIYFDKELESGSISVESDCTPENRNQNSYLVMTYDGINWCRVNGAEAVTQQYAGKLSDTALTLKSFSSIVKGFKDLRYDDVDSNLLGGAPGSMLTSPEDSNGGGNVDGRDSALALCYESAGVLGWIICPVTDIVGNATGKLYEFVDNMLQVQATTIMDGDGPVHGAWETFRDFTNTAFAIVFAVVVLSQLTGIGISNYNIKKILPRLIMVVVLVNISFILCQIAVDASNIIGAGTKEIFEELASKAGGAAGVGGTIKKIKFSQVILDFAKVAAVSGTVTITAASLAVTAATLQYWLIPLLVSFLGMLIGILFFFLILGARQAGIIIMVILAPIAIVCYALPNTKSIFDRWKKAFTALLVVYPICGVLMGGGEYAGVIMLSVAEKVDGDLLKILYVIIGMLMTVIPFFFVPSLLKNSMTALGNIGARISNFGSGFRRGTEGAIRKSRLYQEHQGEAQRQLNVARDKTRVDRLSTTGKGKSLIAKARRGLGLNNNLSRADRMRLGIAQSNVDKATDSGAQLNKAQWDIDGTSNNIGKLGAEEEGLDGERNPNSLVARYISATRRLFKDPTDHAALEEQKAAASLLAGSKDGREQLQLANERLGQDITTMHAGGKEKEEQTARQIMQRTANNLLRTNSGEIAKSPMLDEQISGMQSIDNDYGEMHNNALIKSVGKMSAKKLSGLSKQDRASLLKAMAEPGKLSDEQKTRLAAAASEALSDSRYSGEMDEDAKRDAHEMANSRYTEFKADATPEEAKTIQDNNIKAMSRASGAELNRIQSHLRSTPVGEEAQTKRLNLMNTMGQTLVRAANPSSGVKLSTNQATQMMQTLSENGYDLDALARQNSMTGVSDLQERLDVATGLKVPKQPQATLASKRWSQVQPNEVNTVRMTTGDSSIQAGDWVKREPAMRDGKPIVRNGKQVTKVSRLSDSEKRVAERMQERETESMLVQEDEAFAEQRSTQQANINALRRNTTPSTQQMSSERRQELRQRIENRTEPTQSGQGQVPQPVRLRTTYGDRIERNPQSRYKVNNMRRRTPPPPNPPNNPPNPNPPDQSS